MIKKVLKKSRWMIVLVAVMVGATGCLGGGAIDRAQEEKSVRAVVQQFESSYEDLQWDTLVQLFKNPFVLRLPDERLEEIHEGVRELELDIIQALEDEDYRDWLMEGAPSHFVDGMAELVQLYESKNQNLNDPVLQDRITDYAKDMTLFGILMITYMMPDLGGEIAIASVESGIALLDSDDELTDELSDEDIAVILSWVAQSAINEDHLVLVKEVAVFLFFNWGDTVKVTSGPTKAGNVWVSTVEFGESENTLEVRLGIEKVGSKWLIGEVTVVNAPDLAT